MTATLPPKVLFVDDDRSMRVAFSNASRALGIEAVLAASGGEAIELAQHNKFPVVVTDIRMPGIDGIALVERLSAMDSAAAFVVISANPELSRSLPGNVESAIASLLGKPLDVNEFRCMLVRAFALHRNRAARLRHSSPPSGWSLLIVDDSPGDAFLLQELLCDLPELSTVHATCLQEALQMLHEREFDAIITDLSLPDARGFDAVLRLQVSAPNAALLACSAVEDDALAVQIVQAGAQDFLLKRKIDRTTLTRALQFARERKGSELRLRRLAHFDQLTGLANRASFNDALVQAVARASRQQSLLAVLMIDLDGFKAINDTHGHDAGDRVLQEVGIRLRCLFRDYDVVARLGGDEFAVLLVDVESPSAVSDITERVLASLATPIGNAGDRVTGSIGVAVFPQAGGSPTGLLRAADSAMYAAKHRGRNRCVFFDGPTADCVTPQPFHFQQSHTFSLPVPPPSRRLSTSPPLEEGPGKTEHPTRKRSA